MLWLIVVFVILLITVYMNPGFIGGAEETEFTLKAKWFDLMKEGKKTVEGRLNRGMFEGITEGQRITIVRAEDKPPGDAKPGKEEKLHAVVTHVKKYETPEALLKGEGVDKVMPGTSMDDAIKNYAQYYDERKVAEHGMIAFGINLTKK